MVFDTDCSKKWPGIQRVCASTWLWVSNDKGRTWKGWQWDYLRPGQTKKEFPWEWEPFGIREDSWIAVMCTGLVRDHRRNIPARTNSVWLQKPE